MKEEFPALGSKFSPLLSLTFVLQQSADEVLQREAGIGLGMARILSGLSPAAPRSQRQLASHLRQTEANISRQLKILQKKGLVSITKNKKDGRQRDVLLTKKGEEKYRTASEILTGQEAEYSNILNHELSERLKINGFV